MEDNGYYKQMQQFEDGIPGRGPRYRNQFSRPKVQYILYFRKFCVRALQDFYFLHVNKD